MICNVCPRKCNTDRSKKAGFCGMTDKIKVARAELHFWEEPCISGKKGSGTIFFSGCPLKCVYCQNEEISSGGFGKDISVERLAEIFRELEEKGAHNINLVTPTHYSEQILNAFDIYKPKIPVVYNCSGYEDVEMEFKISQPYQQVNVTFEENTTLVTISTSLWGVSLYVDGVYQGELEGNSIAVNLAPGPHSVTCTRTGYYDQHQSIMILEGMDDQMLYFSGFVAIE